jgi:hypothetical protein
MRSARQGRLAAAFLLAAAVGLLELSCNDRVLAPCDGPCPSDGGSDATDLPADGGPCTILFGDPAQAIQIVPGQFKNETSFQVLTDGSTLDLRFPTQGGQVAYVGARVTNIAACNVRLRAEILDAASGQQIAKEERSLFLVPSPDMSGYGEPEPTDTANFSNVPMCPNYTTMPIIDVDTRLRVTVLELEGPDGQPSTRTAEVELLVKPACNEGGSADADMYRVLCQCECQPGYCLGRCSDPASGPSACPGSDGGADGAGAADGATP